jgi:hypothetical protein
MAANDNSTNTLALLLEGLRTAYGSSGPPPWSRPAKAIRRDPTGLTTRLGSGS